MIKSFDYDAEMSIDNSYDGHMKILMDNYAEDARSSVDFRMENDSIRRVRVAFESMFRGDITYDITN